MCRKLRGGIFPRFFGHVQNVGRWFISLYQRTTSVCASPNAMGDAHFSFFRRAPSTFFFRLTRERAKYTPHFSLKKGSFRGISGHIGPEILPFLLSFITTHPKHRQKWRCAIGCVGCAQCWGRKGNPTRWRPPSWPLDQFGVACLLRSQRSRGFHSCTSPVGLFVAPCPFGHTPKAHWRSYSSCPDSPPQNGGGSLARRGPANSGSRGIYHSPSFTNFGQKSNLGFPTKVWRWTFLSSSSGRSSFSLDLALVRDRQQAWPRLPGPLVRGSAALLGVAPAVFDLGLLDGL